MKKIGAFEAKTHLSEYLREIETKGESVIIQRYGKDIAVLQPCEVLRENENKKNARNILDAFRNIREEKTSNRSVESIKELVENGRKY